MQNVIQKLTRPMMVFDIESTGKDPATDRIVTLAATKYNPDGSSQGYYWECNPGVEMTAENIEVHGITNEMAAGYQPFKEQAKGIWFVFCGCDMAGFGIHRFDICILVEELLRCNLDLPLDGVSIIDLGNIFKLKEQRTLAAALQFYCGKELVGAHGARADRDATAEVFEGQLARYPDLAAMGIVELAKFSRMDDNVDLAGKIVRNAAGEPCYNIGNAKGQPVADNPSFGNWMLTKSFSLDTKRVLRKLLDPEYSADQKDLF